MARPQQTDDYYVEGFTSPNTTPVPDVVFDRLLGRLKEAELKALLYIIRRTFGFKRDSDSISFNQFLRGITTRDGWVLDEGCGVKDRTTLSNALKSLEKKGIVVSTKGMDERGENQTTVYALRFKPGDAASENGGRAEIPEGVVGNPYHPSRNYPPPVVGNSYPQETVLQETGSEPSNIRKRSHADFSVDNSTTQSPKPYRNGSVEEGSRTHTTNTFTSVTGADDDESPVRQWGMEVLGDILKKGRGRPSKQYGEERQMILAFIGDFAREFSDRAELTSSVSRAYNLYKQSGLPPAIFQDRLYQARAKTKERSASIRGSRMAYFFSVLADEVGLKDRHAAPSLAN